MMEKASTLWSKETGIDRNPASLIEVNRPDDSRERFLSEDELQRLKVALDARMYRKGTKDINQTNLRMRLIVLIAVSTGMRSTEIHRLRWSEVMYAEELIAVRSRLKKGKERYVPMPSELAQEIGRYPATAGQDRIFPPKGGSASKRQRLEGSFENLLERANIRDFWFHDLRHTFASWYMMNGGDLYETGEDFGSRQHQDDRALRQARSSSYDPNRNDREGDLEHVGQESAGARRGRTEAHRIGDVRVLFARLNFNSLPISKLLKRWWPETGSNRRRPAFSGPPSNLLSGLESP